MLGKCDEPHASSAHSKGESYAVVCEHDGRVLCGLEIHKDVIFVEFVNESGGISASFQFQRRGGLNQVFLSQATWRTFLPGTNTIGRGVTCGYAEDGNAVIRRDDLTVTPPTVEVSRITYNPSANWDLFPEFGRYEKLINLDRPGLFRPNMLI